MSELIRAVQFLSDNQHVGQVSLITGIVLAVLLLAGAAAVCCWMVLVERRLKALEAQKS